jgi:hypothetical protein
VVLVLVLASALALGTVRRDECLLSLAAVSLPAASNCAGQAKTSPRSTSLTQPHSRNLNLTQPHFTLLPPSPSPSPSLLYLLSGPIMSAPRHLFPRLDRGHFGPRSSALHALPMSQPKGSSGSWPSAARLQTTLVSPSPAVCRRRPVLIAQPMDDDVALAGPSP